MNTEKQYWANEFIELRELQQQHAKALNEIQLRRDALDKKARDLLDEVLGELNLEGKVGVFAYNAEYIIDFVSPNGGDFFIMVDGEWVRSESLLRSNTYPHHIERVDFPLQSQIEHFVKTLEGRSDLPVNVRSRKLLTAADVGNGKDADDVRLFHPGCTILLSEEKLYEGWDIGDPFVIAEAADGIHIYYATNGHGFGFNEHLKPGDSIDAFSEFLGSPEEYLSDELISKLRIESL